MKRLLIIMLISGVLSLLSCQKEEELCWRCEKLINKVDEYGYIFKYKDYTTYCGTVEKMLNFERNNGYTCYLIGP